MFNKTRDFPMEHYNQLMETTKKQSKEIRRLHSQLAQANKESENKDQFIYEQNVDLIQEKNRSSILEKSTTVAQSEGARLLRQTSHALTTVNPT